MENKLSKWNVYLWTEMFNNCQTNVTSAECPQCPPTSRSTDKEEQARAMILDNRKMIMDHAIRSSVLINRKDTQKSDQTVIALKKKLHILFQLQSHK